MAYLIWHMDDVENLRAYDITANARKNGWGIQTKGERRRSMTTGHVVSVYFIRWGYDVRSH